MSKSNPRRINESIAEFINKGSIRDKRHAAELVTLVGNGINAPLRDVGGDSGMTLLHVACREGDICIFNAIIEHSSKLKAGGWEGVNFLAQDPKGNTAMHYAAKDFRDQLVGRMIEVSVDNKVFTTINQDMVNPIEMMIMGMDGKTSHEDKDRASSIIDHCSSLGEGKYLKLEKVSEMVNGRGGESRCKIIDNFLKQQVDRQWQSGIVGGRQVEEDSDIVDEVDVDVGFRGGGYEPQGVRPKARGDNVKEGYKVSDKLPRGQEKEGSRGGWRSWFKRKAKDESQLGSKKRSWFGRKSKQSISPSPMGSTAGLGSGPPRGAGPAFGKWAAADDNRQEEGKEGDSPLLGALSHPHTRKMAHRSKMRVNRKVGVKTSSPKPSSASKFERDMDQGRGASPD